MAEFLGEASVRLGVSKDRLTTAIQASQTLSKDELEVVRALFDAARNGTSQKRRAAISRGILSAIRTVQVDDEDPFAGVDEPMDAAQAARELVLTEMEIESNRQILLKDSVTAAEAASLTGRSRQALERLRRAERLLALRSGNQWRYPRWQFDPDAPGGVVPGLDEVIDLLGLSSAGVAFWLLEPSERLGAAPIDLLRRHRPEPVVQLAREQGYMP
ncbi:MAG TPA: helix-turn-helix domain-containing protein [Gemmatimonadales bacterium]|nr:helix-turn-helix domain-containing protein [Gemmatimonadales bacterium]